uniref:Uncharacterized protein n=1 Tax=Anguilla anguilla TaxID=7936 RepID=A0A0E9RCP6_ANGAN
MTMMHVFHCCSLQHEKASVWLKVSFLRLL